MSLIAQFNAACRPYGGYSDVELGLERRSDRGLRGLGVSFGVSKSQEVSGVDGDLTIHMLFDKTQGLYRIVARRLNPDPAYLLNVVNTRQPGALVKHPLTRFRYGDSVQFYIGMGSTEKETFERMRRYGSIRSTRNMGTAFQGYETLDPLKISVPETRHIP